MSNIHNSNKGKGQQEDDKPILAKIVPQDDIVECGERLRRGDLVAFPTETVYGLGCHALDPGAVSKVFAAKERPLTDPLIVHVAKASDAWNLWEHSGSSVALQAITTSLWPGPLTLVAKAASHVPAILMANTGYVACRAPSHAFAQQLIAEARVPLAAPSANKFGHVSPTRAQHVYDDLKHENVWIIEYPQVCDVGVESTVAKLTETEEEGGGGEGGSSVQVTILRQGAVSAQDMERCLHEAGVDNFTVTILTKEATPDHVATVAPGQTIRHYSPNIPSYMVSQRQMSAPLEERDREILKSAVVIDFGNKLASWKGSALAYRDLSSSGDSSEAAQSVFETLRWAEQVSDATRVLFPFLQDEEDALVLAVKDRLTRAASGVVIDMLQ